MYLSRKLQKLPLQTCTTVKQSKCNNAHTQEEKNEQWSIQKNAMKIMNNWQHWEVLRLVNKEVSYYKESTLL